MQQGFGNEELEEEGAEGEEAKAKPAPDAAREEGQQSVEGVHTEGPVAQDKGGNEGRSQPVRLAKQAWPHIDEVKRLTSEKPHLFELEAFDQHLRGCLLAKDFVSWRDLSETCGLSMGHPNMSIRRDIAASNPRAASPSLVQRAAEKARGQAADAVRAKLEGSMERPVSPGKSEAGSSQGLEAGKLVYVCPKCTIPMGSRRSLQSHLPTCIKAKGALTATQRHGLLKLDLSECTMCNRFFAGRSLQAHKRKCAAEHPGHRCPEVEGQTLWDEHSTVPPEVKDLLNDVNRQLIEEISWEKLGKYRFASQTLMVPWACQAEWKAAFQLPLYLWKEGFTEAPLHHDPKHLCTDASEGTGRAGRGGGASCRAPRVGDTSCSSSAPPVVCR